VTPFASLLSTATPEDLRELAEALAEYLPVRSEEQASFITAEEFAKRFGLTVDAVTARVRRGSLSGFRRGRTVYVEDPSRGGSLERGL
jgi:hypothetical protein